MDAIMCVQVRILTQGLQSAGTHAEFAKVGTSAVHGHNERLSQPSLVQNPGWELHYMFCNRLWCNLKFSYIDK